MIKPLFKEIKEFRDKIQSQDLIYVSRCLGIEVFNKGREIFRFGDYGDKLYIILKGRVSINLPNKEKKALK